MVACCRTDLIPCDDALNARAKNPGLRIARCWCGTTDAHAWDPRSRAMRRCSAEPTGSRRASARGSFPTGARSLPAMRHRPCAWRSPPGTSSTRSLIPNPTCTTARSRSYGRHMTARGRCRSSCMEPAPRAGGARLDRARELRATRTWALDHYLREPGAHMDRGRRDRAGHRGLRRTVHAGGVGAAVALRTAGQLSRRSPLCRAASGGVMNLFTYAQILADTL